jgi:hypothetical protein
MFARVAIFEGIDPAEEERTRDEVRRRVEPIMQRLDGLEGYMDLFDRSSGKALFISLFDSEENMRAAEPTFDVEMPRQLADMFDEFSGRRTGVERYEVITDTRG